MSRVFLWLPFGTQGYLQNKLKFILYFIDIVLRQSVPTTGHISLYD